MPTQLAGGLPCLLPLTQRRRHQCAAPTTTLEQGLLQCASSAYREDRHADAHAYILSRSVERRASYRASSSAGGPILPLPLATSPTGIRPNESSGEPTFSIMAPDNYRDHRYMSNWHARHHPDVSESIRLSHSGRRYWLRRTARTRRLYVERSLR